MPTRLADKPYSRPPQTYQDTLTPEQIREKLQDHTKVRELSEVPLHTHLRYFVDKEDPKTKKVERLFRVGGRLIKKDQCDKFVVLSNGKASWSVNTTTATFFRPLTMDEVHQRYKSKIQSLENTINHLKMKLVDKT